LEHRQRLAHDEPEARVQRERAVVIGGLHEANAASSTLALAPQDRLHERVSNTLVLGRRIDRDRSDSRDNRALVDEGAADDLLPAAGNEHLDALTRKHVLGDEAGELRRARLDRQVVTCCYRLERVVEDLTGSLHVLARARSYDKRAARSACSCIAAHG
jgi:hypothetical protein